MRILTWNMRGTGSAAEKWDFLRNFDADVAILQEARLPIGVQGHTTRRVVKPAADRDDVAIVTRTPTTSRPLPDAAYGQALEVQYEKLRVFGIRSYPQIKEYYPKALLRIVDTIANVIGNTPEIPTVIAGDFNASLDQGPGRDWTSPFRRLHDLSFFDALCLLNGCDERSLPCRADHGKTYRQAGRQYRIDHLYVNRALGKRLRDIRIGEDGWNLSDHRPIVADFESH